MKKYILIALISCYTAVFAQVKNTGISLIPIPVELIKNTGTFILPKNVTISVGPSPELVQMTNLLKERISATTGSSVLIIPRSSSATIHLQLNRKTDSILGDEGYRLEVTTRNITIKANQPAGLFYGVQTLLQLFPKEIEGDVEAGHVKWEIPCLEIVDYPRFEWRGLMFDVARHFFTKDDVKSYIDNMVRYKYNLLHLHLADDEGWRIEIKSFPRLTEVGAWSVKKVGYFGKFSPPAANEVRDYGGFFTQEDIKELVEYAKVRFVNILPEIDVPGHSLAAIASYPELSCTPEAINYKVRSGEPIMDWSRGAPPIGLVDNALCPANEKVYEFIDKVVTEVAALFPFGYIHMGGDEAAHNFWIKNPQIKALMQKEGLKTMEEVQNYFTKRVQLIVASKGKKFIGWDEIMEGGGLPVEAAVMSWRSIDNGVKAAQLGHEVVMVPMDFAYIDLMQGDVSIEPRNYASVRLSKSYQFDPLPAGVNPALIKGGQANLWTENIFNMRHAEYMTWPRAFAVSEALWSQPKNRNWNDFFGRVEKQFERFDVAEIKYALSAYDPIINVGRKDTQLVVSLTSEVEGLDLYYSFDNSFPDRFYPKYTAPLIVPKDAGSLKLISYRGKNPIGRQMTILVTDLQSRAKK
ncbi:beta-N-acetylhexosaminidase [Arcticibacter eurypsychrophilus]|uniref:beta-N-acetylhexosaminidase n=1 Tax=Arcticibacter eurypsychrophilus TaxID=1434752 RepID=UPI00084D0922|nr:family 20 glycosylhydrolase [Arcticibacter eurypsychrophilus]